MSELIQYQVVTYRFFFKNGPVSNLNLTAQDFHEPQMTGYQEWGNDPANFIQYLFPNVEKSRREPNRIILNSTIRLFLQNDKCKKCVKHRLLGFARSFTMYLYNTDGEKNYKRSFQTADNKHLVIKAIISRILIASKLFGVAELHKEMMYFLDTSIYEQKFTSDYQKYYVEAIAAAPCFDLEGWTSQKSDSEMPEFTYTPEEN